MPEFCLFVFQIIFYHFRYILNLSFTHSGIAPRGVLKDPLEFSIFTHHFVFNSAGISVYLLIVIARWLRGDMEVEGDRS
jgi:hypothetical protein